MASLFKQIAVIVVIGAGAFGAWRVGGGGAGAPAAESGGDARPAPVVVTEAARRQPVERVIAAVGAARPARSVTLAPAAQGRVTAILVEGGARVAAGQPILRLDDAEARAALAEAEAEGERARSGLERLEALREQGRVSEADIEAARAEAAIAEAARVRAEKALADRTLRAPFAGVVGFLEVDLGAVVDPGDAVATLDDISALDLDFAAPERYFGETRIGATVRATSPIYPDERFEGAITAIDRRIDPDSRSFQIRARIPNPALRLPAGAFLRVSLVLEAREGVTIPEEAVFVEGGRRFVYVVAEDRAERRAVTLGQRVAGRVEVIDGLAAGEAVIARGVQKARDGAPVRARPADAPAAAAPAEPAS